MDAKDVTQKSSKPEKVVPRPNSSQTVTNETVSWPSSSQPHPMGKVSKDQERTRGPDVQHSPDAAVVTSNPTRKFPGRYIDLLIHLPQFSYIKYVTPEIKHTHYCDDSRFWDNLNHRN